MADARISSSVAGAAKLQGLDISAHGRLLQMAPLLEHGSADVAGPPVKKTERPHHVSARKTRRNGANHQRLPVGRPMPCVALDQVLIYRGGPAIVEAFTLREA
jgi:hypothetical protein